MKSATYLHDLTRFNTFALCSRAYEFYVYENINQLDELTKKVQTIHKLQNTNNLKTNKHEAINNLQKDSNTQDVQNHQNQNILKPSNGVFILGGGSNVILNPLIDSLVIKVAIKGIKLIDQCQDYFYIKAMAGEDWHDFVYTCIEKGWYGLENLALIPGTVGAAPVQNIGAYGTEVSEFIENVELYDLNKAQFINLAPQDCGFSYRNSIFKQFGRQNKWLINSVTFKLPKAWCANIKYPDLQNSQLLKSKNKNTGANHNDTSSNDIKTLPNALNTRAIDTNAKVKYDDISAVDVFNAVVDIRNKKLPNPQELPNAGSFFQNPIVSAEKYSSLKQQYPGLVAFDVGDKYKIAAAWLIQYCGFKGKRIGPVGMHVNQALVMVNYDNASADDVINLATIIQNKVATKFGINLQIEPVFVT